MKKIIAIVFAALVSVAAVYAQDMKKATELAKEANEALTGNDSQNPDYKLAIEKFKEAAAEAAQCTEEGADELVAICKKGHAMAQNAYAQALYKEGKLEEAIVQTVETIKVAEENGEDEIKDKAVFFKHALHQALANAKLKAASAEKDASSKAAAYKAALAQLDEVLAGDPDSGVAYLQKGQVLGALGQKDAAVEAYAKAATLGQEKQANKQLATIYLKEAQALNKAQKYADAVNAALKSAEYNPSANAYKIAGIASQKAGDLQGAADYLQKYLDINPNASDAAQMKAAIEAFKAQLKK